MVPPLVMTGSMRRRRGDPGSMRRGRGRLHGSVLLLCGMLAGTAWAQPEPSPGPSPTAGSPEPVVPPKPEPVVPPKPEPVVPPKPEPVVPPKPEPVVPPKPEPEPERKPELPLEDLAVDRGLDLPFARGAVEAAVTGSHSEPRQDARVPLSEALLELRLDVPLYSRLRWDRERRGLKGWSVLWRTGGAGYLPSSTLSGETERFYQLRTGIGVNHLSPALNLYGLYAGVRLGESEATLSDPVVRPVVLGLGTHRFNDTVALWYGAGYTHHLGRGRILPLIGVAWRMSPAWRFTALLPAFVQFRYGPSDRWRLGFGAALNGDTFGYESLDATGVDQHTSLHLARLRLFSRVTYGRRRGPEWWFEAGAHALKVDRSPDDGDESTYAGFHAETGVSVPFGP